MGLEMNGQSAAIRARHERVFKPHHFPVSTLHLQPRKMASVQGGTQGAGITLLSVPHTSLLSPATFPLTFGAAQQIVNPQSWGYHQEENDATLCPCP